MRDGGGAKESRGDALCRTKSISKSSFLFVSGYSRTVAQPIMS